MAKYEFNTPPYYETMEQDFLQMDIDYDGEHHHSAKIQIYGNDKNELIELAEKICEALNNE